MQQSSSDLGELPLGAEALVASPFFHSLSTYLGQCWQVTFLSLFITLANIVPSPKQTPTQPTLASTQASLKQLCLWGEELSTRVFPKAAARPSRQAGWGPACLPAHRGICDRALGRPGGSPDCRCAHSGHDGPHSPRSEGPTLSSNEPAAIMTKR